MKKLVLVLFGLLVVPLGAFAYKILYAEQWYKLVHMHLYQDPDRAMENIHYLEQALRADFANPLNALAKIRNTTEWERYRYLFYTQVCLLMIDQHLQLGRNFDKQVAYFYNQPWKRENLESLKKAEGVYEQARVYWDLAKEWAEKANGMPWVYLEDLQYWTERAKRIETGDLDYGAIIDKQLERLRQVRADFEAMDANTY